MPETNGRYVSNLGDVINILSGGKTNFEKVSEAQNSPTVKQAEEVRRANQKEREARDPFYNRDLEGELRDLENRLLNAEAWLEELEAAKRHKEQVVKDTTELLTILERERYSSREHADLVRLKRLVPAQHAIEYIDKRLPGARTLVSNYKKQLKDEWGPGSELRKGLKAQRKRADLMRRVGGV